ncbi:FMN reductase [Nocardioides campestrisoli]|uniref:FMN reductase n=1 Tax=Nocardioides campestrisoli TaxID=2736757 RepID=UPI0015E7870E|nr:FMN reductase [Nocardioides campestrisoli]
MTRVVVVTAGLGTPSSTRLLADQLSEAVATALRDAGRDAQVEVVELREHAHALADRMLTGFATGALAEAIELVAGADALIAVTPVFSASYSGLFKTFFDVLEPRTLAGTPVLLAATAGTARHSLVLEHALRPLFAYLGSSPVPTAVFAATEDFGGVEAQRLSARIQRAAGELVALLGVTGVATGGPGSTSVPGHLRAVGQELPDPTPFEELMRRA